MDIQSLNTSAFAGIAIQRPQVATPEISGANVQAANAANPDQQISPTTSIQSSSTVREQLDAAVKATNAFVNSFNNSLEFTVDDDTGTTVVRIVDNETKALVRQIPSEEMLAIAKALDTIKGLLFHQKA